MNRMENLEPTKTARPVVSPLTGWHSGEREKGVGGGEGWGTVIRGRLLRQKKGLAVKGSTKGSFLFQPGVLQRSPDQA